MAGRRKQGVGGCVRRRSALVPIGGLALSSLLIRNSTMWLSSQERPEPLAKAEEVLLSENLPEDFTDLPWDFFLHFVFSFSLKWYSLRAKLWRSRHSLDGNH